MTIEFIDLKAQYCHIQAEVDARMAAVLRHGQFIMGPEVEELEVRLAARLGAKHAIGVSSGTDALLISMMALGVAPGDEVVTTAFTFIASAETIALLGARPVFVDIDPQTYNLDPKLLPSALTARTKAILPVSLYGQCADYDEINRIAGGRGIAVIEDAAQSFGATYKGRPSGNLTTVGCTSFFPSKPLGCYGDGGACFTNDDALATRLRHIRLHGQDRRYHHAVLGVNGRLDTLQAAVVLAKLTIFDAEIATRQQVAARYGELLRGVVQTPVIAAHNRSVFAQYTVEVDHRAAVQERMKAAGVPTAVHYPVPLHLQPVFAGAGLAKGSLPHSERAAERVMSLPMHPYLDEPTQQYIAGSLRRAVHPQVSEVR